MRPAYRHGPPTRRNGRPSRAFRIDRLHEDPLQRPDPAAELVLRDHEDLEIGRAPLQQLAAKLLETLLDRLLVSHRGSIVDVQGRSFGQREPRNYCEAATCRQTPLWSRWSLSPLVL